MTQSASISYGDMLVQLELPGPRTDALPGLPWGAVEAFPTPAYWAYQVLARRIGGFPVRHRLGNSLHEEVAACLLGGHGLPASVGVAAFRRLQSNGLLSGTPNNATLLEELSRPLNVNGRAVRYRFARQKARYLCQALQRLASETPPETSGRALRDWLTGLPGIGFKTSSWIARNWLDADDVAILDIHVLRAGALSGFLNPTLRVERDYLRLEDQFIRFSRAIGARPSELDAIIWLEMSSSPATVRSLMEPRSTRRKVSWMRTSNRNRADEGRAHPYQARLVE